MMQLRHLASANIFATIRFAITCSVCSALTGRKYYIWIYALMTSCVYMTSSTNAMNFTVAYLTSDQTSQGSVQQTQARIISGAMTYAVNKINSDPDLLAGHRMSFVWVDTQADTLIAVSKMSQLWINGTVAFFGPEDFCDVEARIASSWNLPMISYASHVSNVQQYSTRTNQNLLLSIDSAIQRCGPD